MKNQYIIIHFFLGLFFFLISGCIKDDKAIKPSLTTIQVTNITPVTATCGGNISDDGGASVTARGVVWGITENPTLDSNTGMTSDGTGTGSFISNLTALTPNTTYYVQAFATNSLGTEYGNQQTFTTPDGIVVLTTNSISNITATTATCGGNITENGGASITARGVVWDTIENPTLDNNTGITTDGTGKGNFISLCTGLTQETFYHVRAYATNSVDTYYGEDLTFKTKSAVIDIDGNVYIIVTIGSQVWMAENLRTTRYNDGTTIPNVTNSNEWGSLTTGAYTSYNNTTNADTIATYGRLYNWFAVNTGKLAPTGWHVPTDAEWTVLTNYLGGEDVAGGKLKELGIAHWGSPNTGATNETGFTALPGGYLSYPIVEFVGFGYFGYWWSATEHNSDDAWYWFIQHSYSNIYRDYYFKVIGFSIRCIKD